MPDTDKTERVAEPLPEWQEKIATGLRIDSSVSRWKDAAERLLELCKAQRAALEQADRDTDAFIRARRLWVGK